MSILYRTHKSLPASSKISSLYVFDALCRAARSQVVKKNLTGTVDSEKGNCATFLLKIDSVLDGLFQDILSSGIPEAKVSAERTNQTGYIRKDTSASHESPDCRVSDLEVLFSTLMLHISPALTAGLHSHRLSFDIVTYERTIATGVHSENKSMRAISQ